MMAAGLVTAIEALVLNLHPDRALILSTPNGDGFKVEQAHGLDRETVLVGGPVSLTVFSKVLKSQRPLWTTDAQRHPDLADAFSLQVSDIRSIVSVPLFDSRGAVWGILYADRKSSSPAFGRDDLTWLLTCARRVEAALFEGVTFVPPSRETSRRRQPTAVAQESAPPPTKRPGAHPRFRSVTVFFRSLGTMLKAGIPLSRVFDCLLQDPSDPAMRFVLEDVCARVLRGRPLSKAFQSHPRVFSAFQVAMTRAGEMTGALTQVMELLAEVEEKNANLTYRVRSILVYPAFLFGLCLFGAVLLPPLALKGQLDFLKASGAALPAPTKALILLSDLVRSPITVGVVLVLVAAGGWWIRGHQHALRAWLFRGSLRIPIIRDIMSQLSLIRFARAMHLAVKAGLDTLTAMDLAFQASQHPDLVEGSLDAQERIKAGATITQALLSTGCFDRTFLALTQVGEDSGTLEEMLLWQAEMAELEIDYWAERLPALIEPAMLLLVGGMVGLFLVATLSPTLSLLDKL